MVINNQDRFGVIFTITFVSFVLIIILLIPLIFLAEERILILAICGMVFSIAGFFSYQKKPTKIFVMTNRSYLLFFIIGVLLGLLIRLVLGMAYGIDYHKTDPTTFFYGISLAFGGLWGLYFFTAMSMVVSVIQIPFIKSKLKGDTPWMPFLGGVAFGFGIMTFSQLILNGIPKLWFILS